MIFDNLLTLKNKRIRSADDSEITYMMLIIHFLYFFTFSCVGIIPLIVLYSIFRKMRDKKAPSIFSYTFEMSLLIIMPLIMYFPLIRIYTGLFSTLLLSFILTASFIVYLEFVERSLKVKFSIFLVLSWICTALTWFFFPGSHRVF